jgi:hypothetical protein
MTSRIAQLIGNPTIAHLGLLGLTLALGIVWGDHSINTINGVVWGA